MPKSGEIKFKVVDAFVQEIIIKSTPFTLFELVKALLCLLLAERNCVLCRCGYATLHHVVDKSKEDRMESFFLSETCKYLYLVSCSLTIQKEGYVLYGYKII